jgi:hypothetical protein
VLHGFDWVKRLFQALQERGISETNLARWLTWVPLSTELINFVDQQADAVFTEYWKNCSPWLHALNDAEKITVIEKLLELGRDGTAIFHINFFRTVLPTELMMQALKTLALPPHNELRRPSSHDIEQIIKELYNRNDYDRDELGKIEWFLLPHLPVLSRTRYSRVLQEELVASPSFFVGMLEYIYRPKQENDALEVLNEMGQSKRNPEMARRAHDLLHDWTKIPGIAEDGSIDGERLNLWIDEARDLAVDKSRLEVADMHIGRLLSHYPESPIGQQPPQEICQVIDRINTRSIRSGFYSGVFDKQSASTRGVFDGGDRERGIAEVYKKIADSLLLQYPVTASVFESLMSSYLQDAARWDEEAHRDSLDN